MDRAEKKVVVESLNELFKASSVVVVAHYSGLTVAQLQTLRKQMKKVGASVKVAKNRLAKIALDGTDASAIAPLLKGPTLIAYSDDPVAAPKAAIEFRQDPRQVRDPWWRDGQDGSQCRRSEGACLAARRSTSCVRGWSACSARRPPSSPSSRKEPSAKMARLLKAYAEKREAA